MYALKRFVLLFRVKKKKKKFKKKKEDYHAERLLFIAPYSVCSIRKVKIHDFYFQGEKSIPGSSKQTVVWM